MEKQKETKRIPIGTGYGLGLIFGVAIMITFAVVMGATFFGITLGLSFSLSIGIAFECAFAGEKRLPVFQQVILSLSAVLLILSVISLLIWEGI
jgi:CHASE3 domain sensor protein